MRGGEATAGGRMRGGMDAIGEWGAGAPARRLANSAWTGCKATLIEAAMIAVREARSRETEGRGPGGGTGKDEAGGEGPGGGADEGPLPPPCRADGMSCNSGGPGTTGPRPAAERVVCADDPIRSK